MKESHLKGIEEVLKELNTTKEGLTSKEADIRLKKYGLNELPKKKSVTFIQVFISQFKSPIVYILLIAMVLSFVVKETTDGVFIFLVVICDAILGAIQEYRSNKNADNLRNLVKMKATTLRDGKVISVDSSELVLGDIVLIESGTRVAADLRLIETSNLSIDESLLTGESIPREKHARTLIKDVIINDRDNMAFVGTSVMRGRAKGVVVATATDTQIGKIAKEVLDSEETKTPLQIRMDKFTKQLGIMTGILALIVATILYFKNYATREIFFLVIALSISSIPEGLPVVITLALSISSNKMAKKNILVKKLNAVEALGSATIIATDKTGTLTLNEQTVKKILLPNNEIYKITGSGYNDLGKITPNDSLENIDLIIKEGIINNEATLKKINKEWISLGDSMDIALLSLGLKYKLKLEEIRKNVVSKVPYESENGYSASFYLDGKKIKVATKGTLEKILKFSTYQLKNGRKVKLNKENIRKQNEDLATEGYRVLAFATGEIKNFQIKDKYNDEDFNNLTFLGLIAFEDPIRKDAKEAVNKCKNAGIKVIMITGDHPLTALNVGKEIGISSSLKDVITGNELDDLRLKGYMEFDDAIKGKTIFSRVTPVQKLEIIESFKRNGEFIAVSGDGVNDSPALKAANVSIAMGSGTDVAKETSSMIILDDKFSSIVNACEEGRGAYDNVRKVAHMLLSCGVCEILFYLLAIIFDYDIPLTAIQLLWLNLVTDGIQDVALSFESTEASVMKRKPRKPTEGLFDKLLISEILINGITMGIIVFSLWVFLISVRNMDISTSRSYILLLMVFIQNVHCFNARSEKLSIFDKPLKDNKYLIFGILSVLILQIIVSESKILSSFLGLISLPFNSIIILLLLTIPVVIVSEIFKHFVRKKG